MSFIKSLIAGASIVATALTISFSAPALAGNGCDSIKSFAQSLEQTSSQKTTVECYEQELAPVPAQVPSHKGAEVFISLAALLAGGWGLVAALSMNKTQVEEWDYGFSSEPTPIPNPSPIIWWEKEIFNPNDLNWEDESPIRWEDLDTSTIEWNELDISDIQWNDDDDKIEWEDLSPIQWDDLM